MTTNYESLTVKQLKAICQSKKHTVYHGFSKHTKKANLVAFMIDAEQRWEAYQQECRDVVEANHERDLQEREERIAKKDLVISKMLKKQANPLQDYIEYADEARAKLEVELKEDDYEGEYNALIAIEEELNTLRHGHYDHEGEYNALIAIEEAALAYATSKYLTAEAKVLGIQDRHLLNRRHIIRMIATARVRNARVVETDHSKNTGIREIRRLLEKLDRGGLINLANKFWIDKPENLFSSQLISLLVPKLYAREVNRAIRLA